MEYLSDLRQAVTWSFEPDREQCSTPDSSGYKTKRIFGFLLARVKLVATLSFDLSCVFFRVVQGLLLWNLVVVVAGQYQQPFKASS